VRGAELEAARNLERLGGEQYLKPQDA
jgi:hypothetical protein